MLKVFLPFQLALSLLTRIPSGFSGVASPEAMGRSVSYYGVVGALIGLVLVIISGVINSMPEVEALLLLLIWVGLTGGIHLDGLADSADAWIGGMGSRERTFQILKDPHIGVFGVLAIVLLLLSKWVCLVVLVKTEQWAVLLMAPIVGRGMIQACFMSMPYVSIGGMGAEQAAHSDSKQLRLGLFVISLLVVLLTGFAGLVSLSLVALFFWFCRNSLMKRMSGFTGDFAGAITELGEVLWLLLFVLLFME